MTVGEIGALTTRSSVYPARPSIPNAESRLTEIAPPKSIHPCPACGFVTSVAAFRLVSAVVNYYLCKKCGHIWAVHQNDPTLIDHFTPLPEKA